MSLWTIGSIYAQVGVNTETPATTLHVLPGKTNGTTAEGIIAPNLKRSEVIAKDSKYATAQTGAMVYVSDLSGVLTTKTAKIITTGYITSMELFGSHLQVDLLPLPQRTTVLQ